MRDGEDLYAPPSVQVPVVHPTFGIETPTDREAWDHIPAMPPFLLVDGSGEAREQTELRICHDAWALHVRFECFDRHIWGILSRRDDPIYQEEVVEVFLAPGEEAPVDYYEFEVSPTGVLFDATVHNPTSVRADMRTNARWDCPGIAWGALIDREALCWRAHLTIPWTGISPRGGTPSCWRANFCRIERPRDGPSEFSCWSPTLTEPPDFHKPTRFGKLYLSGSLER